MTGENSPFRVGIHQNVANGRDVVFEYEIGSKNSLSFTGQIILNIQNGKELSGVMDSSLVLSPDRLWIVSNSFRVDENGTLNVLPGCKIVINSDIINRGIIRASGKKDSMITIEGPGAIQGEGEYLFEYTYFNNLKSYIGWPHSGNSILKFLN